MRKIGFILSFALVITMLLTGCRKNQDTVTVMFGAKIEDPEGGNEKTHFLLEKWICWDQNDAISVGTAATSQTHDAYHSGDLNKACKGILTIGSGIQQGTFQVEGIVEDGQYGPFLALYPYNSANVITYSGSTFTATVNFPAVQRYQNDTSFGHNSCPMVGYTDDQNLEFHSLCGIARIELYSTVAASKDGIDNKLDSITFILRSVTTTAGSTTTTQTCQLSGDFSVINFLTNNPHLQATASSPNDAQKRITIDCHGLGANSETGVDSNDWVTLGTGEHGLRSFYLTLPALSGDYATYALTMRVKNENGKYFEKNFSVKIRRRAITKIQAIEITHWTTPENSTGVVGIVGNGTQLRPFQIYSITDLQKVRDAFVASNPSASPAVPAVINGINVTANTYFQIMRSDITLTTENWTRGIPNFMGHLTYNATSSNPGVTNNSKCPFFESITASGDVKGLTMKGTLAAEHDSAYRSLLCGTNRGTIRECIAASGSSVSCTWSNSNALETGGAAALCIHNYGTMTGCYSMATVNAPAHVAAGIALFNYSGSNITNCHADAPGGLTPTGSGSYGGSICYSNAGTVQTCYATLSGTTACNLGGIVCKNTGTVQSCFLTNSTAITTSSTLGGIVNDNQGVVDYCYNAATSLTAAGTMGGIVATNSTSGIVRNCWVPKTVTLHQTSSTAYVGGLAGVVSAGNVYNCYARAPITCSGSGHLGYALGQITGGSVDNCYCSNGDATSSATFYANRTGGKVGITYTSCYAINYYLYTSGYVNICDVGSRIPLYGNEQDLTHQLQSGATSPDNCHGWDYGSDHYPVLTSTIVSSSKKSQRRPSRR